MSNDTMNDAFIYTYVTLAVLLKLANVALLIITAAAFESADLSFSSNADRFCFRIPGTWPRWCV